MFIMLVEEVELGFHLVPLEALEEAEMEIQLKGMLDFQTLEVVVEDLSEITQALNFFMEELVALEL
tara:strand:+ start:332 stop:529 length:198 start_codon:yes stop_codon:yes gene_type:complete